MSLLKVCRKPKLKLVNAASCLFCFVLFCFVRRGCVAVCAFFFFVFFFVFFFFSQKRDICIIKASENPLSTFLKGNRNAHLKKKIQKGKL